MGNEPSKPVAVVELLSGRSPRYNVPALKGMLKSGPAEKDTKVFVICISGVYRSGKSFLLNLLKVYLDHYCKHGSDDGWIENDDIAIRGGNWAQGQLTVTHGIWMYMYPQLINNKAIILMDCQGTKDIMKSTPTLDNQIMFLALQMSDVHILNVERSIGADDLDRLDLCIFHADEDSTEKLFRRQVFLIRNWGNSEKPQQLDEVIEGATSGLMKNTAIGINNAFDSVDIESLPYPGPGVDGKSEIGGVHLRDVDGKFLQDACVLFRRLIQQLSPDAKYNLLEFIDRFEYASSREVVKITTSQEVYEESVMQGLYRQLMEHANIQIKQLETEVKMGLLSLEMVEEKVTGIFDEVQDKFMAHKRVKHCKHQHILNDHQSLLERSQVKTRTSMVNGCISAKISHEVKRSKEEADEKINSLKIDWENRMAENDRKRERERENEREIYNARLQDLERENAKLEKTYAESKAARLQLESDLQEEFSRQLEMVRRELQSTIPRNEDATNFDDSEECTQTNTEEMQAESDRRYCIIL